MPTTIINPMQSAEAGFKGCREDALPCPTSIADHSNLSRLLSCLASCFAKQHHTFVADTDIRPHLGHICWGLLRPSPEWQPTPSAAQLPAPVLPSAPLSLSAAPAAAPGARRLARAQTQAVRPGRHSTLRPCPAYHTDGELQSSKF